MVDVTDKAAPRLISSITYSNGGYTHQGWIDAEQRYFYLGDELDEVRYGNPTRTLVFDMSDLDNLSLHHTYLGVTDAIDHNGYTHGNHYFQASYTAGFREIDISDIQNQRMQETGFSIPFLQITALLSTGFGMFILFLKAESLPLATAVGGCFWCKGVTR